MGMYATKKGDVEVSWFMSFVCVVLITTKSGLPLLMTWKADAANSKRDALNRLMLS